MQISAHHAESGLSCVVELGVDETVEGAKLKILRALDTTLEARVGELTLQLPGEGELGEDELSIADTALQEGGAVEVVDRHDPNVRQMSRLLDGEELLTVSRCETYMLLVSRRMTCVRMRITLTGEALWVARTSVIKTAACFSHCAHLVAFSKGMESTVAICRTATGELLHTIPSSPLPNAVAFTACAKYLLLADGPSVVVVSTLTGRRIRSIDAMCGTGGLCVTPTYALTAHGNSNYIVLWGLKEVLRPRKGGLLSSLRTMFYDGCGAKLYNPSRVTCVNSSECGAFAAVGGDRVVTLWCLNTKAILRKIVHEGLVDTAILTQGRLLCKVTSFIDAVCSLSDIESGKVLQNGPGAGAPWKFICVSHSGEWVYLYSEAGSQLLVVQVEAFVLGTELQLPAPQIVPALKRKRSRRARSA